MKRRIYKVKDDYEMDIDPDTYNANAMAPQMPTYRMPVNQGNLNHGGVYMQPNGMPVMVMPMLAGGNSFYPVQQQVSYPITPTKRKK